MSKKIRYILLAIIIQIIAVLVIANYSLQKIANYGIDMLIENDFKSIKGKKVAVLANKSSIDKNGDKIVDILNKQPNIELVRIFSPEHGFEANYSAGEVVNNNQYNNIDIISLYGKNRKPSKDDFKDIDVIVIDIQDIGSKVNIIQKDHCITVQINSGSKLLWK